MGTKIARVVGQDEGSGDDEQRGSRSPSAQVLLEDEHGQENRERCLEVQEQRSSHAGGTPEAIQHQERPDDSPENDDADEVPGVRSVQACLSFETVRARQESGTREPEAGSQVEETGEDQWTGAGKKRLREWRARAEEGSRRNAAQHPGPWHAAFFAHQPDS